MKKIILIIVLIVSPLFAQLIEENFNYNTGSLIVVTSNWTESPAGQDVAVVSDNLSYDNYQSSGLGNRIYLDSPGSTSYRGGVIRTFTATSSGTIYFSFLVNVTSTTDMGADTTNGDYFANFQSSTSTLKSMIVVRKGSTSTKFSIGLKKTTSGTITWHSTQLDVGSTYLIVMSYTFTSGNDNDPVKLWINPSLSGTEPEANVSITSGADNSDIGVIQFRQSGKSGDMYVDGVRVATSWSQAPLPVELIAFTGEIIDDKVQLNWETATEINNFGFEVERKLENDSYSSLTKWKKIGFVSGNGNSNSPKKYVFTDLYPPTSKVSYRLKQVDFNGAYEYSPVVNLEINAPVSLELLQNNPNPFNPETIITYKIPIACNVKLQVYDVLGKEVHTLLNEYQLAGTYSIKFSVTDYKLSSGIYVYQLLADNKSEMKKMLVLK